MLPVDALLARESESRLLQEDGRRACTLCGFGRVLDRFRFLRGFERSGNGGAASRDGADPFR